MNDVIPIDEQRHYDAARQQARAADVDPPETEDERMARLEQERHERILRNECKQIVKQAPRVLRVLRELTTPRPGAARIMTPACAMSFAETAAYRMGQYSIVEWIDTIAREEKNDG